MMSEKRYFKVEYDEEGYLFDSTTISEQLVKEQAEYGYGVFANSLSPSEICELLNKLNDDNEQLRLELETHKHPLWSTREAERKVNKLADSLADEVRKNELLNEEINQLRIENMRLKKKGSDIV